MRLPYALAVLSFALLASSAPAQTPCVGGSAGAYPCDGVDLMAHLPLSTFVALGSTVPSAGNDIWGWTDPATGREYALMGTTNGTAFVDVSDPAAPVFLGRLPTQTSSSSWRDVKTIGTFAYIVSEAGGHGIQVFDLTALRDVTAPPVTFAADAVYTGIGKAHNVVVLEDADLVIAVGANQGGFACNAGGLHMVDVSNPRAPAFAGCFDADGYTHDAQCLTYDGPDSDYVGRQICVASNEDTVTIVDVTSPTAPVQVSKAEYPNDDYTHQGWFTEDQRYFVVNDELDGNSSTPTRTIVMDLLDLDSPEFSFFHSGTTNATDHNLYVVGSRIFQSNYTAGLQILDASTIGSGTLSMTAFFDTEPANDAYGANASTGGQWSNYPFFESGIVVASDIKNGLFVLAPQPPQDPPVATVTPGSVDETVAPGGTRSVPVSVANGAGGGDLYYAAEIKNLTQPFARPSAAGPAAARPTSVVFVEEVTEAGTARVDGRPSGVDPAVAADDPDRRDEGPPTGGLLGSGGPDGFGYAWVDSDEPDGPAAALEDISTTGTALALTAAGSFPAGDEGYADVALPFAFNFYGAEKTSARVYSNGFLTFSTIAGTTYNNPGAFPGASSPVDVDDVVAPFWDDLDAGGAIYAGTLSDGRFAVQWTNKPRYADTGSSLTFQAVLSEGGDIEFQYGSMVGSTLASAGVGIENADGSVGLTVAGNAPYVTSNKAVRFFSPVVWATLSGPTSGTVAPGGAAAFSLDLDAAGLPEGTYTADLVVSTNDPATGAVTIPVTLTVGDAGPSGPVSIVIGGQKGSRFLGAPADGVTVDDLAAQNLVRGVPGYYPNANNPNLWTEYDPDAQDWVPSAGTGEGLRLGYAFKWLMLDRAKGNPDKSVSVELPFTLSTAVPANTADVDVVLETTGNRQNFLGNPFGETLYLDGLASWPGASGVALNKPVYVFDVDLAAFVIGPTEVAPWGSFRVKGDPAPAGSATLTIPASATTPPAAARTASREADRRAEPSLSFALSGRSETGRPVGDRAMVFAFRDGARAAFSADEDDRKLQPLAADYALVGARTSGPDGPALAGFDARPFAAGETVLAVEARGVAGPLTLSWDAAALPTGLPVVLVDLVTGAEVDVRTRAEYRFEVASAPALSDEAFEAAVAADEADGSRAQDRFVLRVGSSLASAEAAGAVSLEAVAPNPSSGGARVSFATAEAGAARVSVVDVRGREVAVLVDGPVAAGRHEVRLGGDLAAGVYVVRLETAGTVLTRRAVVVR